jgi:hypothetical protein
MRKCGGLGSASGSDAVTESCEKNSLLLVGWRAELDFRLNCSNVNVIISHWNKSVNISNLLTCFCEHVCVCVFLCVWHHDRCLKARAQS